MSKRSKEMVEGCCVCSDEQGYNENPIVYCDGCNIAVHQACYGIVAVPSGPWFCRRCESLERNARVKCELCPFKEGALKKTDSNGWAHVVCALYIPEVRFGNVTTMEPISLNQVPAERFTKSCYICVLESRGAKASTGACMQCNKPGCKQQFHVLCGQAHKLLCEETGNQMDNVKYCGYCQHHNKAKKGGAKSGPAQKSSTEHDTYHDKESSGKKKSYLAVGKNFAKKSQSPSPDLASVYNMDNQEDEKSNGSAVSLKIGTTSSHSSETGLKNDVKNKFTTSNFVESVVTPSEPVFGSDKTDTSPDAKGKKRKTSTAGVKTDAENIVPVTTVVSSSCGTTLKPVSVTLSQLKTTIAVTTCKSSVTVSGKSQTGAPPAAPPMPAPKSNLTVYGTGTKITIAASRDDPKKPKTEGTIPGTSSAIQAAVTPEASDIIVHTDAQSVKRPRSGSQEKGRKNKRPQNRRATPIKDEPDSPPQSPEVGKNRKKAPGKEEKDVKDIKPLLLSNLMGNQLNPASSSSHDPHKEEVHNLFSQDSAQSTGSLAAIIPRKFRATNQNDKTTLSAANSLLSLGNSTTPSTTSSATSAASATAQPEGLAQLLERQWEQGHQFLMEQGQHFDIASLLSCLHQLKRENTQLEEHVQSLTQRRDHLLAVNARLSLPLPPIGTQNGPTPTAEPASEPRTNGGDAHPYTHVGVSGSQANRTVSLAFATAQHQQRRPVVSQYQNYTPQPNQINSNVQSNPMMRRDDPHQM